MSFYRVLPRSLLGAGMATLLATNATAQSTATTQAPSAPGITRLAPSGITDSSAFPLDAALSRSETTSRDIVALEAEVAAAEARARQAGFRPNPEVSLQVENFLGSGSLSGLRGAETTLGFGQAFELGGKRRARAAAAGARVDVARLRLAIARADLRSSVRDRYAELAAADQEVLLAQARVERARELFRIVTELVDAGRDPPLRQLRAQATLAEATIGLQRAQVDRNAAQRALGVLFGADATIGAVTDLSTLTLPENVQPDPTQSLDLRLAEAEVRVAEAEVDVQRSLRTPDITVQGGVRRFEDSGDAAFLVGVSAPIPIRNRNQGEVAAVRAEAAAAIARRERTRFEATRRAADARAAFDAANARVSSLERVVGPQAEEAVRLARLGYQAGRFTLLEVLDAEEALNTAQTTLTEARLERARAAAALERAAATRGESTS